jgi:hypothetical protein
LLQVCYALAIGSSRLSVTNLEAIQFPPKGLFQIMTQTESPVTPQAALTLNANDLYDRSSLRRVASEATLIRWERSGKLKSVALGRRRFYLGSDLLAALQSTK